MGIPDEALTCRPLGPRPSATNLEAPFKEANHINQKCPTRQNRYKESLTYHTKKVRNHGSTNIAVQEVSSDMIEVYKISHGFYDEEITKDLLQFHSNNQ